MRVLVTGGTGVVGTGTVTELLRRGHSVVLVSRHADEDARQWPAGVTPWKGDVANASSISGSAVGCDAILHVVGIVEEGDGDATFEKVNVQGTQHMLDEARRASVNRFVFVSSLGAPAGRSEYHKSKQRAESLVRKFGGSWTICRPGNVYGPGDEQISVFLRLVRGVSPIVPKVGEGDQPFQPIWWEDCARALAECVERNDLAGKELDLAGTDVTSQNDLLRRFSAITGKDVIGVALPEFVATLGAKAISLVGWDIGFTDDQLQMLREGNVIARGGVNGLTEVLHITPTPLDTGLRALCDMQPEQLPDEGVGTLKRKRFWADISGTSHTPESLFAILTSNFNDVTPVFVDAKAEPGAPTALAEGETITLALPMRGHVQVRVTALEDTRVTLLTLLGHPLAGAVRFETTRNANGVRFQIEVYDRAANMIDLVAMRTLGDHLQKHTWEQVVENMVKRSGGSARDGVQHDSRSLDDAEAKAINTWLAELTLARKREENADAIAR